MFKKLWSSREGISSVEMALIFSVIALLLPIIVNLATLIMYNLKLEAAVRAGEQYAYKHPDDTDGMEYAAEAASNLPSDAITAEATQACECSQTAAACGVACGNGVAQQEYTTITVSYNYTNVFSYGNSSQQTTTKQITIRTQ